MNAKARMEATSPMPSWDCAACAAEACLAKQTAVRSALISKYDGSADKVSSTNTRRADNSTKYKCIGWLACQS